MEITHQDDLSLLETIMLIMAVSEAFQEENEGNELVELLTR